MISLFVTLLPLVLGLVAWILSITYCITKKSNLLILSWVFCACALWCPIQVISGWAEKEDIASILDCSHAYFLCATVLLVGNLLLTGISLFRKRGKT